MTPSAATGSPVETWTLTTFDREPWARGVVGVPFATAATVFRPPSPSSSSSAVSYSRAEGHLLPRFPAWMHRSPQSVEERNPCAYVVDGHVAP